MEATQEQKDVLERVVTNAKRVMTHKSTKPEVLGLLSAGQSTGEGFSNALTFVLKKVVSGLMDKGVEISPAILMSENGGVSQIGQLLVAMIEAKEEDITPNEIQKGLEIGIHNFSKMLEQGGQEQPAQPPQQPPQGMLAGAQTGGA